MKILLIIDPLRKLDWFWDNSLYLAREFIGRGHQVYFSDVAEIWASGNTLYCHSGQLLPCSKPYRGQESKERFGFIIPAPRKTVKASFFDLILVRKEPPFDSAYFYLTILLGLVPESIPVLNRPHGLRNLNEKLSILQFPKLIPRTLVTSSLNIATDFRRGLENDMIMKPLDQKGGKGVILIPKALKRWESLFVKSSNKGKRLLMLQERVSQSKKSPEKRIFLLDTKPLAFYAKRPLSGEFRANLGLGSDFFPCTLDSEDRKIIAALQITLKNEGICFAGLDVLGGKLLEINVTCPAGLTESKHLFPKTEPVKAWADSLEDQCGRTPRRASLS